MNIRIVMLISVLVGTVLGFLPGRAWPKVGRVRTSKLFSEKAVHFQQVQENGKILHLKRMKTLAEVVEYARKPVANKYADLEIRAHHDNHVWSLDDQSDFEELDPSLIYNLTTDNLSHEFNHYTAINRIAPYLLIDGITEVDLNDINFNQNITTDKSFKVGLDLLLIGLQKLNKNFEHGSIPEGKACVYINHFLTAATDIANAIVTDQPLQFPTRKSAILTTNRNIPVRWDMEKTFIGTRAWGKLDYLMTYNAIAVTLLEAKELHNDHSDSHTCQLGAQLKAMHEQEIRRYISDPINHILNTSTIQACVDSVPRYGIVYSGASWEFVRYRRLNGAWLLERAPPLSVPSLLIQDMSLMNMKTFHNEVKSVLQTLTGMVLEAISDQQCLHAKLAEERRIAQSLDEHCREGLDNCNTERTC